MPQSGSVLIDGTGVGDVSEIVLRDRQHLGNDGFLVLMAGLDAETGELVVGPEVISRGFVYMDESAELVDEIKDRITEYFDDRPQGVEIDHSVTSRRPPRHDRQAAVQKDPAPANDSADRAGSIETQQSVDKLAPLCCRIAMGSD